jgi:hypothetical protein
LIRPDGVGITNRVLQTLTHNPVEAANVFLVLGAEDDLSLPVLYWMIQASLPLIAFHRWTIIHLHSLAVIVAKLSVTNVAGMRSYAADEATKNLSAENTFALFVLSFLLLTLLDRFFDTAGASHSVFQLA